MLLQIKFIIVIISYQMNNKMHTKINQANKSALNKEEILAKALYRLVFYLDLNRKDLSLIIGLSEATISRLFNNQGK